MKKILYAVQATGNGHIARAIEIVPYLQQYGEVHVFLSGNNSSLNPSLPVKYTSKGLSLFYRKSGDLNYARILSQVKLHKLYKEAQKLPVDKYDLVINDFEFICALACKLKKVPMIHLGHQASFKSKKVPRPKRKDPMGEWLLENYCRSKRNIGFHFEPYEPWILPPVIKESLWKASPSDNGHITVYLPHYSELDQLKYFSSINRIKFQIFSPHIIEAKTDLNIEWYPINNQQFTESMIHAHGVICGAGFETPAEALFLKKKLMVVPIQGQYEQFCNAAALEKMGVSVVPRLDVYFGSKVSKWYKTEVNYDVKTQFLPTKEIIKQVMEIAKEL